MKLRLVSIALAAMLAALVASCGGCPPDQPVRPEIATAKPGDIDLVLMIVIDALRADAVTVHRERFGADGLGYLIENGAWFATANYPYAPTLTAVGHASIFTGGTPAEHGIVGNHWFDRRTGEQTSAVVGPSDDDPDERLTGPMHLTANTIGDELLLASDKRSRVFGVSVKARGAILPGGRLGKAIWFSGTDGEFVTSNYYYPNERPAWLADWNRDDPADEYKGHGWELLRDRASYVHAEQDDRPEERTYNEPFGRSATFPHSLAGLSGSDYYNQLRHTPFADELILDLVERLVRAEQLGQRGATDLLAVSFSATDAIGHAYGPASLEYEDNLLRIDDLLARFRVLIDETVGLAHTLIVLTSDHGMDMIPEFSVRQGRRAGRIGSEDFARAIDSALQQRYDTAAPFTIGYRTPSVYLNLQTIEQLGLDIGEVEAAAAAAVMTIDGIAAAVTRTDLLAGNVPDDRLSEMLVAAFHPERSGNILVYQERSFYLYQYVDDSAMHGSPYDYDTHVPLLFAGPGIAQQTVDRPVSPLDIAPTIARILGIARPSGSSGELLVEVLPR